MSSIHIDGKEMILLPISVIDKAGQAIYKNFYLSKRHLDYVKAQSFVVLWVKRGIFQMENKQKEKLPAYALTKEEYKFFTELFNATTLPF